jgi:5-methylcytosine-specific restriction endonuclease McrA
VEEGTSRRQRQPRNPREPRRRTLKPDEYAAYIRSAEWQAVRQRYFASPGMPQFCMVCGSSAFDLHHMTYRRLGHERLSDLWPLCREHHLGVHALMKETGVDLAQATRAYAHLHRSIKIVSPNSKKNRPWTFRPKGPRQQQQPDWSTRGPLGRADYAGYINSSAWASRRKAFLRQQGARCQGCDTPRAELPEHCLHVHHRTYVRLGHELPEDLAALCLECHKKVHALSGPG